MASANEIILISVLMFFFSLQTNFEDGEIVLTTHRLLWGRNGEVARGMVVLCLHLKHVIAIDEETASSFVFGRKKRIIITLKEPTRDKTPGPMDDSTGEIFIKLSGRNGIEDSFMQSLSETVSARIWETTENDQSADNEDKPAPRIKLRTGIVGIERSLLERQKQTDENITLAFKDLSKLMTMAKDMVAISKVISSKIRERHGDISEDETIRFKSYLMSLGIDDPVTRDNAQSNSEYFQLLANQICEMLLDPITEAGGMMSMADVYCRVNRARGLELLSPEDLLNACHALDGPIKLRTFPSGAMVLQLESHSDEAVSTETLEEVIFFFSLLFLVFPCLSFCFPLPFLLVFFLFFFLLSSSLFSGFFLVFFVLFFFFFFLLFLSSHLNTFPNKTSGIFFFK